MAIIVFHNQNFIDSYFRQFLNLQPIYRVTVEDLEPVAIVDTDDLSEAYNLVQHLRQGWQHNPRIQTIKHSRSTAVGDVLQTDDGSCWLVALSSFEMLPDLQLAPVTPETVVIVPKANPQSPLL